MTRPAQVLLTKSQRLHRGFLLSFLMSKREQVAKSLHSKGNVAPETHQTTSNIDNLTDADLTDTHISEAIRYLESDPAIPQHRDDTRVFALSISLFILLVGCLSFIWLYR
jgi:hypothetical protein